MFSKVSSLPVVNQFLYGAVTVLVLLVSSALG